MNEKYLKNFLQINNKEGLHILQMIPRIKMS